MLPQESSLLASAMWVGDVWIPPNGRLFTVREIQHIFSSHNTLILGDSLGRRFTANLASILLDRTGADLFDNVMDEARLLKEGGHGLATHIIPDALDSGRASSLVFSWAPTVKAVTEEAGLLLSNRKYQKHPPTLIIVLVGVHDAQRYNEGGMFINDDGNVSLSITFSSKVLVESMFDTLVNVSKVRNATVLFRTTPHLDTVDRNESMMKSWDDANTRVDAFNRYLLKTSPPRVHMVDAAKFINVRAVGKDRIKGDSRQHYGNIIRMLEIQCITHKLYSLSA